MSYRVLYVDDDRANLIVFEAMFRSEVGVLTAASGAEALAVLAARDDIGVLLTDERMPGMTGTQLAEHVAAAHPDVIRMLVTAYSDLDTALDAINRGHVHQFLRKPWDATELRAHVRDALALYTTRRQLGELQRRLREVERVYGLGVVVASVVHELRNPMGVIAGYLDVARGAAEELAAAAGARGADHGGELGRAIDGAWQALVRMDEIARGVELSTRRRPVDDHADVGDVVALTLRLVSRELARRATVHVDVPPGHGARIGPTQLGQVTLNLVTNALQALPEARATGDNHLRITVARDGATLVLEIADNGPGVPDDHKARVFDPFFTTKAAGGTGLGLAISKQIVEDAGGRLRLRDTDGGGATFRIELPAVE